MLQQDRHINQIRTFLTGRILKTLKSLRDDDGETYLKFWSEFGRVMKEGMMDHAHREKVQELLLFASLKGGDTPTSLAEAKEAMVEGQDALYYLTGESRAVLAGSPHLEAFKDRDIDVLLLDDPVDELVVQHLAEYNGVPLKSAAKGAAELGDEDERAEAKEKLDERTEGIKPLLEALQKHLENHVKEVRLSDRLKDSPACLVGSEHDLSPHLERLLRQSGQDVPTSKRILELNPEHPVMRTLEERFAMSSTDERVAEAADLLHGYALLAEGSPLPDPARFSRLFSELLTRGV
jgi:molecular chaperone HtpG